MNRDLKRIIRWKAVEQYFKVALFVFQFSLVSSFGELINVGFVAAWSERVI